MKRDERIEEHIANVRYRSSASVRREILAHLDETWRRRMASRGVLVRLGLGGEAVARLPRVAFVALLLIVAAVWIAMIDRTTGSAYALAQTADAVNKIRYFHFQFVARPKEPAREAWIEYDPCDAIRNVRVNFYDQNSVMVWSREATQYWNRDNGNMWVFRDDEYTEKVLYFVQRHDPRQAIAYLQARGMQNGIQINIAQPQAGADPITVTVEYDPNTYLIGKMQPRMREFYHIDPLTKLIVSTDVEAFLEGRYVSKGTWEYIDYNRPFDPRTFDLRAEAPADANWSDTTGIAMGIEQGPLSDEEVAVELVRKFLDAWTARDYDRAAQIYGYTAAREPESLARVLGRRSILHVVSIGPPIRAEEPLRGLFVPSEVECEENGQKTLMPLRTHVSQYSKGRWRIRDIGMGP
ncbi:MAG: hypothetical protein JW955_20005 [Sedimentisphaerales bacterium]|nr:hypothetical protein [Sedimentisphaerales bacterium]